MVKDLAAGIWEYRGWSSGRQPSAVSSQLSVFSFQAAEQCLLMVISLCATRRKLPAKRGWREVAERQELRKYFCRTVLTLGDLNPSGETVLFLTGEAETRSAASRCSRSTGLVPYSARRISVGSVRSARSTAGSVATSAVSRMAHAGKAMIFGNNSRDASY